MKMQKTVTETATLKFTLSPEEKQVFNENYRGYEEKVKSMLIKDAEERKTNKILHERLNNPNPTFFELTDKKIDEIAKNALLKINKQNG